MSHNSANPFDFLSVEVEPGVRYCYDNSYIVDPHVIERDPFVLARLQRRVFVKEMTPAVNQYNRMSMSQQPILVKEVFADECIDPTDWKMSEHYKNLSVTDICNRLLDRQQELGLEDELLDERNQRIVIEMKTYKDADKLELIRLMCYIVDRMTEANQIWGVGRGSSVSSYVLFLIGVHDIDSVLYDLDFTDFMKSQ